MAAQNGFNPVPRSQAKILKGHQKESPYVPIADISIPNTPVVRAVDKYVKAELSPETYNHSVRVYFYGYISFVTWSHYQDRQLFAITSPIGNTHLRYCIFHSIVDDRCITLRAYCTISEPHQRI
jgi:hypothetical protein